MKRAIGVLLILMALAYFWNDPVGAGHGVRGFFYGLGIAASKILLFIGAL